MKHENSIKFYDYNNAEIVSGTCVHRFPLHIHKTLCIGMITGGCADFFINGRKTLLSAGDCYFIPPCTPHSLSSVDNTEFSYMTFRFKNICPEHKFSGVLLKAKNHIEKTAAEFNLDGLSEIMYISKYHLLRRFKNQFGITPYQFYISEKVRKIRQGLQKQIPLSDLVFDSGFYDQSHLCNTFKKHMGITPLQYASSFRRF